MRQLFEGRAGRIAEAGDIDRNPRVALYGDRPMTMSGKGQPELAERFEVYVCGVELANGFDELTDPAEQEERFVDEMSQKKDMYGETWPVDDDFIEALKQGMPPSGGIALGVDRLVMLVTGADNITDVLWCG